MKRRRLNRKESKRIFTTTALKVHPKNLYQAAPERGGYRL